INSALGLLELTQMADQHEWARAVIKRQTRQLTRLIDDLLDISRITRGKIELQREWIRLDEIIERAAEVMRPIVNERKQRLIVRTHEARLNADPARLEQIFLNLLGNASKFTPEGGDICIESCRDDGHVAVSVQDSGIGVPPEMRARIFDL